MPDNPSSPPTPPRLKPCPEAANWQLQLRPSKLQVFIYSVTYATSAGLILLLNSPLLWKLAACCALTVYGRLTWKQRARQLRFSAIVCNAGKIELVKSFSGERIPAQLFGSQWVSEYLCVLHLTTKTDGHLRVPLFYDSATPEDLRKMRVFLKSQWYLLTAQAPFSFWPNRGPKTP